MAYLRAQRRWYALLGLGSGAAFSYYIQKDIATSIEKFSAAWVSPPKIEAPKEDKVAWIDVQTARMRRSWNTGVDKTFGSVVEYLSSKGL